MYAQDSIELLKNAGLNFSQHQADGIDILKFGRLMLTSGLVLMPEITWMSFHSGYDFGYLVKILTNTKLPTCESEFFSTLKLFFSSFYDIKLLIGESGTYKGGLQELAEYHNVILNIIADRVQNKIKFFEILVLTYLVAIGYFFGSDLNHSYFFSDSKTV